MLYLLNMASKDYFAILFSIVSLYFQIFDSIAGSVLRSARVLEQSHTRALFKDGAFIVFIH